MLWTEVKFGKSIFFILICDMITYPGKPFNPHLIMNNAVSNIICSLIFGHRFEYDDEKFLTLIKMIDEGTQIEGSIWAQVLISKSPVLKKAFDLYCGFDSLLLINSLTAVQWVPHADETFAGPTPHPPKALWWNIQVYENRNQSAQERLGPLWAQRLHRLLPEWDSSGRWTN